MATAAVSRSLCAFGLLLLLLLLLAIKLKFHWCAIVSWCYCCCWICTAGCSHNSTWSCHVLLLKQNCRQTFLRNSHSSTHKHKTSAAAVGCCQGTVERPGAAAAA